VEQVLKENPGLFSKGLHEMSLSELDFVESMRLATLDGLDLSDIRISEEMFDSEKTHLMLRMLSPSDVEGIRRQLIKR